MKILFKVAAYIIIALTVQLSEAKKMQVLIVGGGITGLSTAIALEKAGITADLIEKRKEFIEEGAGIAIPANATWALKKLGIDISKKAYHVKAMQFTDHQGNILNQHDITKLHPASSQFYAFDRSTFHKLLLSHVKKTKISKDTSIVALKTLESGKVEVKFSSGLTKEYDLVIGADGIQSSIRKNLYPSEQTQYLGIQVWRTIISKPHSLDIPIYMLGKDRALLLYPINNNKAYVYGHIAIPEKQSVSDNTDQFLQAFQAFKGLAPEALKYIKAEKPVLHAANMEASASVQWGNPEQHILLVGDAAHAFGPMLQNGAAQGVEDAYVLYDLLKAREGKDISTLLKDFIERRNERATWVSTTSNVRIKAITSEAAEKRNAFIREKGAPNYSAFQVLMKTNP